MKKSLLLILVCALAVVTLGSCGGGIEIPAGNINNYGYVLVDGNDMYYTKVIMTDFSYYGNIYRYNMNTQIETLIAQTEVDFPNEMNAFMTLYDGHLYFLPYFLNDSIKEASTNIYRIKLDNSEDRNIIPEPLFEEEISCTFMQIVKGTLYYYDDMEGILYSMKPDGTNRKTVAEAAMDIITIRGNNAYFMDFDMLYSVSLRGGEPRLVFDFSDIDGEGTAIYLKDIIADGNYIYFLDDSFSKIGRIRNNGRNFEEIYTVPDGSVEYVVFLNISGDTLFFVAENYGEEGACAILSLSTKGGEPKVIVSDSVSFEDILPFSIWGDVIYFCGMPRYDTIMDSHYVWFTVRRNGERLGPFKPFSEDNPDYDADDWDLDEDEYEDED
jgi:hypothetical protein